nr:HAMP domain-containing protein [Anaerolineae bacterium]
MTEQAKQTEQKKERFISLRAKVLVGFTLIFAIIFAAAFYWFYTFATKQAMTRIQDDLRDTIIGAAEGVDGDLLMGLYYKGEGMLADDPGESEDEDGLPYELVEDDPQFQEILDWLVQINDLEPRAFAYVYIKRDQEELGPDVYEERDATVVYIADRWMVETREGELRQGWAVNFMEPKFSYGQSYAGFSESPRFNLGYRGEERFANWCERLYPDGADVRRGEEIEGDLKGLRLWCDEEELPWWQFQRQVFTTYTDDWGQWVSAYHPVTDSSGEVVGAIGIDFEASYVRDVQAGIRSKVFLAFGIVYSILFIFVFIIARQLTQPIISLTGVAERIADGDYEVDLASLISDKYKDEIDTLANVFDIMVGKVYQREQSLKKRVAELEIMIDQTKVNEQVSEIVDSDFFQELQAKAASIRNRSRSKEEDDE